MNNTSSSYTWAAIRMALIVVLLGTTGPGCPDSTASKHKATAKAAKEATPTTTSPKHGQSALLKHYRPITERIIARILNDNDAFNKLRQLCDGVGHRFSGSKNLEKAISWAATTLEEDGHENVSTEEVMVPHWERGAESLQMLSPLRINLPLLGLGGSVGTPGITAEVLVAEDEDQLKKLGAAVKGKIVLFNKKMPAFSQHEGTGYGKTVKYRVNGARLAAAQGAVAALVRSVTANSLRTPHTGAMSYGDTKRKIPAASITTEDADLIARLVAKGKKVRVKLKMGARDRGLAPSANVVAELRGHDRPDEIVVIGGHIDSWDVGQGAHDDGSGCVMAMEALSVLRQMKLVPRRTIRVVLWTNEENGLAGAKAYAKRHAAELAHHVAAIEADSGAFRPRGFRLDIADPEAQKHATANMKQLLQLLEPLGATTLRTAFAGADISALKPAGVPLLGLFMDRSTYFDYHHTHADTLDKVKPEELSQSLAAMAVMAYVLADMPGRLDAPQPKLSGTDNQVDAAK